MGQSIGHGSPWWSKSDIEFSQILIELSRAWSPFTWGSKRRRSAIQDPPFFYNFKMAMYRHGGADGGAVVGPSFCDVKSQTVVKGESSSPASPLSLSPSESDEKPKHSRRKPSLKRKKEYYLEKIEGLKKNKASLNQELENVKRHHSQLKALNLKLKARKQELSNGSKSKCQNPNLEIDQLVHANATVNSSNSTAEDKEQKQKQQQMHMRSMSQSLPLMIPNQNQTFGSSQTNSVQLPSSSALGQGPLPFLDLNVSPKECIYVDSYQPLDATMANKDLSKTMAAQARQRRLNICRLKKPMGNTKPLSIRL